ncbi:glycoside hydrolase family 16 protein [Polaribacter litorisediminis]|uniref:glycoside hydrolase family 16 protein n=1 Tax=Polaribacter litorisediminis TaxID=1908341 RepID=UPI001CBE4611|nr:glycoside hydrolase family 16 protein [Polaribacter litorisediminis]UAM98969.1 glycoside hydrolase family 16 protein [Polaribacter litorisediminis]
MKKIVHKLIILSISSIILISCKDKEVKNNTEPKKENILSKIETKYNPSDGWELTWSDEFDAEAINENNWTAQVLKAGHFNDEWQRYTSSNENAYIENNCLVIKAMHKSDVHGMDQYTSARMHTGNKQSFKYGKISARIKLPEGKGIWPAFWMLGANINEIGGDTPWPKSGEIDILELYGSKDDGMIEANIHFADSNNKHAQMGAVPFKLKEGKFADNFHVFELEWDSEKMTWFVDGKQFASTSITADHLSEFHKEFYILLNLAVGGTYAGRPDKTTKFPQYMFVDWVRVYKKK